MPERQISEEQLRQVNGWLCDRSEGSVNNLLQHSVRLSVWDVDGEPFIITGERCTSILVRGRLGNRFEHGEPTQYYIFCSNKHARELETEGIVGFSKELQLGAQTP